MRGKLQRRAAAALALAGVLGIVRAADALLLCEDTTGFAAGGPWPRLAAYALLTYLLLKQGVGRNGSPAEAAPGEINGVPT